MTTKSPAIIVFSGPSGCGKSTIINQLKESTNGKSCISVTTRKKRPGEVCGKDYHFLTHGQFDQQSRDGEFLEEMVFNGNRYGTRYRDVESALSEGCDVYMDLSCEGASSIRRAFPETITVFILPPSYQEVRKRLLDRGMSESEIEARFADDDSPIARAVEYDLLVVNHTDRLDETIKILHQLLEQQGL